MFRKTLLLAVAPLCLIATATALGQERRTERRPGRSSSETKEIPGVESFRIQSQLLSDFWGRPSFLEAGVVLPPDHDPETRDTPVCYSIHGFGGSHRIAWAVGPQLRRRMRGDSYPPFIYVYLNARCPLGHHEFADSVNNGPVGRALLEEFIPAIEEQFGAVGTPEGRFLTGHSSGGWSSLWLQVNYPDFFAGTWSTAPDSVDFRDFTGINVYDFKSAYFDPQGNIIQLQRKGGSNRWVRSFKDYSQREAATRSYGGQIASFDAVFSPRGEDGRPMEMFDRKTGKIDPIVAEAWKKYDIRLILKDNWTELGPKLKGKLHILIGNWDTFRLEGAVKLLKEELEALGSDAEILIVDKRDHGSIKQPHPEYWPQGMLHHVHHEMWKSWQRQAVNASPLTE